MNGKGQASRTTQAPGWRVRCNGITQASGNQWGWITREQIASHIRREVQAGVNPLTGKQADTNGDWEEVEQWARLCATVAADTQSLPTPPDLSGLRGPGVSEDPDPDGSA